MQRTLMPPIVEIKDLHFAYNGQEILKNIDLTVNEGDFLGLIGPNGSGKTTLLRLILGLLPLQKGQIKLCGQELTKFNNWEQLGYVQQKATQTDQKLPITVEEIVSLVPKVSKQEISEALNTVGLVERRKDLLRELSGGLQQRVFIAKAIAAKPKLLILDEPTVGIDIESEQKFYKLLSELNQKGITIILVSHDVDVIVSQINKLIGLNKTIVYQGDPAGFIDSKNLEKLYGHDKKFIFHDHEH